MADYIDREALLKEIDEAINNDGLGYIVGQTMKRYLKRQPVADVASVVRCKDCARYREYPWGEGMVCMNYIDYLYTEPNDFCSYGERRK